MLYLSRALTVAARGMAKSAHPNESIALLQGRLDKKNNNIYLDNLLVPPGLSVDEDSAHFDQWQIPSDTHYLGVFHSHPLGSPKPSLEDILASAHEGGVQLIISSPYALANLKAYRSDGTPIPYSVVD